MIAALVGFLKYAGRPSSIRFLLVVLGGGAVLSLSRRTWTVARWYYLAMFAGFWLFSTPACAARLVTWSAGDFHALQRAADARGAQLVVVLSGGTESHRASGLRLEAPGASTAFRIIEAARVYRLLGSPSIILSGGPARGPGTAPEALAMREAILQLGIPLERLILETESLTTRDEATIVRRLVGPRATEPFVLVTSPTHMRRAMEVFAALGLRPIASPSAYVSDGAWQSWRWSPDGDALSVVDDVVYDQAAWLYYWARGWLGAAGR